MTHPALVCAVMVSLSATPCLALSEEKRLAHGAREGTATHTPLSGRRHPAGCVVRTGEGSSQVRVTDRSRRRCLSIARYIEPDVPVLTDDSLRAGPPSHIRFRPEDVVYCRLHPREKQGGSLKFRCMRTNEHNQFYDADGELVPQAVASDDEGKLLDAGGKPILTEDGKPSEGDELRVKYFTGSEPDPRYREMFTETVVSTLFWALGIPVDRTYMPASVRCFGCSADPFGQMQPERSRTPRVFELASIERPYDGRKIAVTRRSGWLGLGGKYDHGFGFDEIAEVAASSESRIEAEVMALALNIVGYNNMHAYQNDLICVRGKWDRQTGECNEVVAYVSDVGGTLGGARTRIIEGEGRPEMLLHPRGDFITFSQGAVFADAPTCTLYYAVGPILRISEAARATMAGRIRGRMGREQLRIIFERARIHRLEKRINDLVGERYGLEPGPKLDHAVQLLWADEMVERLEEVLNARCDGVPGSIR